MFNSLKKFNKFDRVSKFRLINSFLVAIAMSLIAPIMITLKGTLLFAWIISMLAVAQMLAVKTNDYMVNNFTISNLYQMGVLLHFAIIIGTSLYFYSPLLMVWIDSVIVILEVAIFSAYSIVLNNHITDNYPKDMKNFQIVRNSSWADGALLGLLVVTLITFFGTIGQAVIVTVLFNIFFVIWMFTNWNFYKDYKQKLSKN